MLIEDLKKLFFEAMNHMVGVDAQSLEDQGHKFDGDLIDSLEFSIEHQGDKLVADHFSLDYGRDLDEGTTNIRSYKYYKEDRKYRRWVSDKFNTSDSGEIDSIIYFVWKKWNQFGFPLDSSKQFSKTGEVTGWTKAGSATFEKDEIPKFDISPIYEKALDEAFKEFVNG